MNLLKLLTYCSKKKLKSATPLYKLKDGNCIDCISLPGFSSISLEIKECFLIKANSINRITGFT